MFSVPVRPPCALCEIASVPSVSSQPPTAIRIANSRVRCAVETATTPYSPAAAISINEGTTAVTTVVATDADGDPLSYDLTTAPAGMTITAGRIKPDSVLDYRFVVLSHNTIRGAAGAAILNAELLVALNRL